MCLFDLICIVHSSLSDTMSMFWMYGHTPTGLNIYEFSQSAHILNNMGMALATQVINFLIKQLPLGKEISLFSES